MLYFPTLDRRGGPIELQLVYALGRVFLKLKNFKVNSQKYAPRRVLLKFNKNLKDKSQKYAPGRALCFKTSAHTHYRKPKKNATGSELSLKTQVRCCSAPSIQNIIAIRNTEM